MPSGTATQRPNDPNATPVFASRITFNSVRPARVRVPNPSSSSTLPADSDGSINGVRRSHLPMMLLTQPAHWPARA